MFVVEITYRTRLGSLSAVMSTSQTLGTIAEAEQVREALRAMPGLTGASIKIKNAPLPPTVDEALDAFRKSFCKYTPTVAAAGLAP